jgi:general secretion pathway protein H
MLQRARNEAGFRSERGFTLLEVVCVIGIMAMLATLVVPLFPHGTSRAQLQSYAMAAAALLKSDREVAIAEGKSIATELNPAARIIHSGATDRVVEIPGDVKFDTLLAAKCSDYRTRSVIRFFSSGMSCGGAITLTRVGFGYQIRVNWLTGGVEIVALDPA